MEQTKQHSWHLQNLSHQPSIESFHSCGGKGIDKVSDLLEIQITESS
jgi:hypothetical protein